MNDDVFDLIVVGGGINGTAVALDAAGRGLSVLLCERDDLAAGTSSASSKLVHGGIRYLEHREFAMVRAALKEREVLLRKAPHIIWPMQFVMPHHKDMRAPWLIRIGLFLYDHLAPRKRLAKSRSLDLHSEPQGKPLKNDYAKGFSYSDCWVDDARLVVLNAMLATQYGANICTRTALVSAQRVGGLWQVVLQDRNSGRERKVQAHGLVNAAGPWLNRVVSTNMPDVDEQAVRLSKGSHIVVDKLYHGDQAYILQNTDGRVVFTTPYCQQYTLIGTTDEPFDKDPSSARISEAEKQYLCDAANLYFTKQINPADILWSYSGVRMLMGDEDQALHKLSRDYSVEVQDEQGKAPLVLVFGGKITTHRCLAESVMSKLEKYYPQMRESWTHRAILPGGDMPDGDFYQFYNQLSGQYHWLPPSLLFRYARAYGTLIHQILAGCESMHDLGHHYGKTLYQVEVDYLKQHEWAQTAEDILWRRSKLGIQFAQSEVEKLRAAV